LPVPIKQEHSVVNECRTCGSTPESRQDAAAETVAYYTQVLAWFTGVLALATLVQGAFLYRADIAAKRSADASRTDTERSMDLAEKRFLLEGRRADTTEKQIGILRTQFFAEHRPKLEIKFVRFLRSDEFGVPSEAPVGAEFIVINTGTSEANVIGSKVALLWLFPEDIPLPTDLEGTEVIPKRRFTVGATDKLTVLSNQTGGLEWVQGLPSKNLYLLGWVVYADGRGEEFGSTRTTYFGRIFNRETRLFTMASDLPDWEFIH